MTACRMDRPSKRACIGLGGGLLAGVVVRVLCLRFFADPHSVDSIYCIDVARNICEGRGLVIDYAWIYARGVPESFPMPSHGYWNPGHTFFLVPWMAALGTTYRVAQIACICLSIPFTAIIWWVARELMQSEAAGLLAAGLAAVEPHFITQCLTADPGFSHSFWLAACLLALYVGALGRPRALIVAGFLAGLAHLTRNDGMLLVPVSALVLFGAVRAGRLRWSHGLGFLAAYALVMVPWVARNTVVFGAAPPPEMRRLLFLPEYNEIFRADWSSIAPTDYLTTHGGLGGVVLYRLKVAWFHAKWAAGDAGAWVMFIGIPALAYGRRSVVVPYIYMLGVLVVAYILIVPEVGMRGAFPRSFPSLYPLVLGSAAGGVVWASAQVSSLSRRRLSPSFAIATMSALLVARSLSALGPCVLKHHVWSTRSPYVESASVLRGVLERDLGDGPILTDDTWRISALVDRPVLQMPSDGQETVLRIARQVGARYAVMRGACLQYCQGLREAIDRGDVEVLQLLETAPVHEGIYVIDLFPE